MKFLFHRKQEGFRKILVPNGTNSKKPTKSFTGLNASIHPFPQHIVCGGTGPLHFPGKLIYLGLSCPPLLLPLSLQLRCKTGCFHGRCRYQWEQLNMSLGSQISRHPPYFPKENSTFSCKTYVFPNANFSSAKIASPSRKIPNHLYTQRQILGKTVLASLPLTFVFFFCTRIIPGTQALSHGWNC